MTRSTTRPEKYNVRPEALYLAFELSNRTWKLGMTVGFGQKARERNVAAGDLLRLKEEILAAKERFGLARNGLVYSCYEAGRDGFWIHRALQEMEVENVVVDPSSIEVPRRKRRAKTDRLDVHKLLRLLLRYRMGERKVWSVVRVPSVEAEDDRHMHRELAELKRERTQHINRIRGLLAALGVRQGLRWRRDLAEQLKQLRLWDGSGLPPAVHCRLLREAERLQFVQRQIQELESDRAELLRECRSRETEIARQMTRLRGIGANGAWVFAMEFFCWRNLRNRRQVGALAGLTPTPHSSGDLNHEQGISKSGNRYVRAIAIELAWSWLRFQPRSQLSQWFQERFAGSPRLRRVGIVALARKLLIALWRWVDQSILPAGAELKVVR